MVHNQARMRRDQATTSALLKLLRRRLTLLKLGRSDFVAGLTTVVLLTHPSAVGFTAGLSGLLDPVTSLIEEVWWGRLEGTRVGRREGIGEGGAACREPAPAALAAAVVLVVASRGILFGPCLVPGTLTGSSGTAAVVVGMFVVPALRILEAPAVDRVTRVGRCSEAVTPRVAVGFETVLDLLRVVAFNAGRASCSSSSTSDSSAPLFAFGVLRG